MLLSFLIAWRIISLSFLSLSEAYFKHTASWFIASLTSSVLSFSSSSAYLRFSLFCLIASYIISLFSLIILLYVIFSLKLNIILKLFEFCSMALYKISIYFLLHKFSFRSFKNSFGAISKLYPYSSNIQYTASLLAYFKELWSLL